MLTGRQHRDGDASHHLTTLRDAGLIAGSRVGRRLAYLRTGLGEQLGGGAG